MSDKKSNRIPADQLTAYERWELPAMQISGNDVLRSRVTEAEAPVKPLTAADLENIRQQAYQAGLDEGKEEGIKAGHQEGFDKGFLEGKERGVEQGLQEGRATGQQQKQVEIDESLKRLQSVMEQLLEPIRQHDEEIEEALLNLVLAISRAVVKRELLLDSRQIKTVLLDALALLPPSAANVKVRINPADSDHITGVAESVATSALVIMSDDILPGGCKVETLHSLIDFTVEKRFQKTIQQMLDRHTSSLPPDEAPDLADAMGEMTDFHRDVLESPAFEEEMATTPLSQQSEDAVLDESVEDPQATDAGELADLDETGLPLQDKPSHDDLSLDDLSQDDPSQDEFLQDANTGHEVHLTDAERAADENVSSRITPGSTGENPDESA